MRLTKRRNGIWMLEYRHDGRRVRVSTGKRDRAAAEIEARKLVTVPPKGDEQPQRRLAAVGDNLGALMWKTYETVWRHSKSAASAYSQCKTVDRELGHLSLPDVTYGRLQDYVDELREQGLKPATINRRLAVVGRAMTEGVRLGKLPARPAMPTLPEDNQKERYLSEAEEARLLEATRRLSVEQAEYMRPLLVFLLDTGCRLTEALTATEGDVTEGGAIIFPGRRRKNGRSIAVPLTERAAAAIGDMLASPLHGHVDKDWCIRRFGRLRRWANVEDVTLHTLRHTCASRLLQRGVDIYRVSRWLGHSTLDVTASRYAHLSTEDLRPGVSALESVPSLRVVK